MFSSFYEGGAEEQTWPSASTEVATFSETTAADEFGTLVVIGFVENVADAIEVFKDRASTIFLIDRGYKFVLSSSLPYNVSVIPDDATRVFAAKVGKHPSGVKPPYQAKPYLSSYHSRIEYLASTPAKVTYVCTDYKLAANAFELAALVKTETFENRFWLASPTGIRLSYYLRPYQLPDIFNGKENAVSVKNALPFYEKEALKELILQGIDSLRCFLTAGYHIQKNDKQVPGWALQTSGVWLALIIGMFQIIPGALDKTHQDETNDSSCMRKLLCDATLFVLSNYIYFIVKPLANEIVSVREMVMIADAKAPLASSNHPSLYPNTDYHRDMIAWTSPELWKSIRERYASSSVF